MIPVRNGQETTAADHLATDAMARAAERIKVLLHAAKARLDLSLSATVADTFSPLRAKLDQLEMRVSSDDGKS